MHRKPWAGCFPISDDCASGSLRRGLSGIGVAGIVFKVLLCKPLFFLRGLWNIDSFDFENEGRVPSLQQAIIMRSSFVHLCMMEPPCKAV